MDRFDNLGVRVTKHGGAEESMCHVPQAGKEL